MNKLQTYFTYSHKSLPHSLRDRLARAGKKEVSLAKHIKVIMDKTTYNSKPKIEILADNITFLQDIK